MLSIVLTSCSIAYVSLLTLRSALLYSLRYRRQGMNVRQKADVGLRKETQFTKYAIALLNHQV
jgi:hypothetical protein